MIIGIHGKARSGKDQFGEYLMECLLHRHRRSFIQMAFATELKQMCKDNFDLTDEQLWGDDKEVADMRYPKKRHGKLSSNPSDYWTAREIMQSLGSFYRTISYDFWVDYLEKMMKKRGIGDVVVTDVRHVNEGDFVKNNQGVLIKVTRPDADNVHGMEHESETALDDTPDNYFDIEIDNSGTLEDLYGVAESTSDAIMVIERTIKKGRIEVNG